MLSRRQHALAKRLRANPEHFLPCTRANDMNGTSDASDGGYFVRVTVENSPDEIH